jgi:hypothetical protein
MPGIMRVGVAAMRDHPTHAAYGPPRLMIVPAPWVAIVGPRTASSTCLVRAMSDLTGSPLPRTSHGDECPTVRRMWSGALTRPHDRRQMSAGAGQKDPRPIVFRWCYPEVLFHCLVWGSVYWRFSTRAIPVATVVARSQPDVIKR